MKEEGEDKFSIEVICYSEDEPEIRQMEQYINDHWKEIENEKCWSRGTPSRNYSKNNRKKVENGTHNFLGGEIQRKRLENGTHPFLDGEISRKNANKRVENGTHNFQVGMMTALNIETGEIHRISKDLYHSRKDIYFTTQSKVFKEWKKKKTTNVEASI